LSIGYFNYIDKFENYQKVIFQIYPQFQNYQKVIFNYQKVIFIFMWKTIWTYCIYWLFRIL